MKEIKNDFKQILTKIFDILFPDDSLISREGRDFLNDPKKMEEFYEKLKRERENSKKEVLEKEENLESEIM